MFYGSCFSLSQGPHSVLTRQRLPPPHSFPVSTETPKVYEQKRSESTLLELWKNRQRSITTKQMLNQERGNQEMTGELCAFWLVLLPSPSLAPLWSWRWQFMFPGWNPLPDSRENIAGLIPKELCFSVWPEGYLKDWSKAPLFLLLT